ncbi:MAG: hypothetical protein M0R00_06395 [Candidatus Omnitrophica bacterium]|jgi:hypothetical protein|nr:hypothetical protein [Candidatus Omnitrophota bacterium]
MSTPTQYPDAQHAVGGQPTVTGWIVNSSKMGFVEDSEDKQNANGTHRSKIVYSRRRTWDLEMEAESGTTVTTYVEGGEITIDDVLCNITSAFITETRGPTLCSLSAIEQAEHMT